MQAHANPIQLCWHKTKFHRLTRLVFWSFLEFWKTFSEFWKPCNLGTTNWTLCNREDLFVKWTCDAQLELMLAGVHAVCYIIPDQCFLGERYWRLHLQGVFLIIDSFTSDLPGNDLQFAMKIFWGITVHSVQCFLRKWSGYVPFFTQ